MKSGLAAMVALALIGGVPTGARADEHRHGACEAAHGHCSRHRNNGHDRRSVSDGTGGARSARPHGPAKTRHRDNGHDHDNGKTR